VIYSAFGDLFFPIAIMSHLNVQSDLLVVKKQKKRYCPIYFQKEDIERELTKASKTSRGSALSKQIMVCDFIVIISDCFPRI
jgi:hypothetical protein